MTDDLRPEHLKSNQPPPEEAAGMDITTLLAELEARKAEILAAFTPERLVVVDNDTIGRTASKIAIAKRFLVKADGIRREVKDPYDRAAERVQSVHANFVEDVVDAINRGWAAIRKCRDDQRTRSTAAMEAQRAEEAQLRAAAAPAVEVEPQVPMTEPEPAPEPVPAPIEVSLPTVRSDLGAKVSDQKVKTFTIDDPRKLPDSILDAPAVRKAMLAAIKTLARLQETIPGVTIGNNTEDKIRRAG